AEFQQPLEQATADGDIQLFRRVSNNNSYEYMARGELVDVKPDTCHDVFVDLDYRRAEKEALSDNENTDAKPQHKAPHNIYWLQEHRWPIQNRDYYLLRESRIMDVDRETTWIILTKSDETAAEPEQSNCIRVKKCRQTVVLQASPASPFSTTVYVYYEEDPRGTLPTTLFDWVLSKGVPSWIKRFAKACENYGAGEYEGNILDGVPELTRVLDESFAKGFTL
ncbi:hypothetical protein BDF19DRAFT_438228, partial [Syncephalis fuscata]